MEDSDQSTFMMENAPLKPDATGTGFPDRYAIKAVGTDRVLTCLEAPNLQVIIKAGLTFTASAARKAPPGTIYLDGVAQLLRWDAGNPERAVGAHGALAAPPLVVAETEEEPHRRPVEGLPIGATQSSANLTSPGRTGGLGFGRGDLRRR